MLESKYDEVCDQVRLNRVDLQTAKARRANEIFLRRRERLERFIGQMSATEATLIRSLRNVHSPEFGEQLSTIRSFINREADEDFPEYIMYQVEKFGNKVAASHNAFTNAYELYDRQV